MKRRIINGEMQVLCEVYLAFSGLVAHWIGDGGRHIYENLKVHRHPDSIKHLPIPNARPMA